MEELRAGLWQWKALHPAWRAEADWDRTVTSYAVDDGTTLVLLDPLDVPAELFDRAAGRDVAIVLTCRWHERDAKALAERFGVAVHVPAPDPDDREPMDGRVYEAGAMLPGGIEARAGIEPNDMVLWIGSQRVLVCGDSFIDRGRGLEIPFEWPDRGETHEQVLARLQSLLDLPFEHLLVTHGDPFDRAAVERALAGALTAG